jgi:hypothetical protein
MISSVFKLLKEIAQQEKKEKIKGKSKGYRVLKPLTKDFDLPNSESRNKHIKPRGAHLYGRPWHSLHFDGDS